jgi:hypothetical protein
MGVLRCLCSLYPGLGLVNQVAGSEQGNTGIYAQIGRWAVLRLREPNRRPTLHVAGYVVKHSRFMTHIGSAYVGPRLGALDLERRIAANHKGGTIALLGEPLPGGRLPNEILRVLRRTCRLWELPREAAWERLESAGAQPISLEKPEARIEQWDLILSSNRWYLVGLVFDHCRLPNGRLAVTSEAMEAYISNGAARVETQNTVYRLGTSAPRELSAAYKALLDERLREASTLAR